MKRATEFAASIPGARLTLPSRPLLYRKEGEAAHYFTETDLKATFERLQKPAQQKPRRVK